MKHIVIDACLPPQIVTALKLFNEPDVYYLHEKFQVGALDEYFIPELAKNNWILLTQDLSMGAGLGKPGKLSPQAKVMKAYRAMAFFVSPNFSNHRSIDKAWRIFRCWKSVRSAAEGMSKGQIFDIQDDGRLLLRP